MNTPKTKMFGRVLAAALVSAAAVSGKASAIHDYRPELQAAAANTAVQQALLDSTSHHLDTLRMRMNMPQCTMGKMGPEAPADKDAFWMVYDGGYDSIGKDAGLGSYSRSHHGLLMGLERQLCCNSNVGLAFGYERSDIRCSPFDATDDTYFLDLYSSVRTGDYNHKFSFGMGLHDMSTTRNAYAMGDLVTAKGSSDSRSFNLGYELSKDYKLSDRAMMTPFLSVNYAYIDTDSINERWGDYRGVRSNFGSMNLLQLSPGIAYTRSISILPHQAPAQMSLSLAGVVEFSEHQPDTRNSIREYELKVKGHERDRFFGQLGMNLTMPVTAHTDVVAGAYGRMGENTWSAGGNIGLRWVF